jgi:hypothetical protein
LAQNRVGIGTAFPQAMLEVASNTDSNLLIINNKHILKPNSRTSILFQRNGIKAASIEESSTLISPQPILSLSIKNSERIRIEETGVTIGQLSNFVTNAAALHIRGFTNNEYPALRLETVNTGNPNKIEFSHGGTARKWMISSRPQSVGSDQPGSFGVYTSSLDLLADPYSANNLVLELSSRGSNANIYARGYFTAKDGIFTPEDIIAKEVSAQSFKTLSDSTLKQNIVFFKNGLEKISSLNAYQYTLKSDIKNKPHIGVMAQELQAVLPQLVNTNSDGKLSVSYGELTAVLLQAIKEQQVQIDALTQKIEKLTVAK